MVKVKDLYLTQLKKLWIMSLTGVFWDSFIASGIPSEFSYQI